MITVEDVEGWRRSHAMAPLSPDQVTRLLNECAAMAVERRRLTAVLDDLRATLPDTRQALNRLARIITP